MSTAMSRYRRFTGRAERDEYFWFSLIGFLWYVVAQAIDVVLRAAPRGFALVVDLSLLLVTITLLVPTLALTVRRLHDAGRSGRWVWLWLVPVLGPLTVFVLNCFPGTDGDNRYGPPADAHHRDFRSDPSPRDRSPWEAVAVSGTALGVVGVLVLAGLGARDLVRPPRTAPAAAGRPGSTDGRSGAVADPRAPAVRAVPVPPPVSAAPAVCPPPGLTDLTATATSTSTATATATPHPAGTPDGGPIAPDDAGVTVTPDVGPAVSSTFFAPLYEISGRGSRRVRVALPDRKTGVEVSTDGPVQVWGVPAGTEATRASAYDNRAGNRATKDIGGKAGEWDIVVEASSATTSWTVDFSDTIPGAGAATFAPTTTNQDCSDVTVTTGTGAGQWTVAGHGSRHVLIDLPGGETGSGGASSDGNVSLWLLPTDRRPSDGLGADYANGAGSGGLELPPGARGRYGLWVQTLDERTTWRLDLD